MSGSVVKPSKAKNKIAEEAKEAAIGIVKDAIDKRCYGFPISFRYTCAEPIDSHVFCCVPTEQFLQELLAKIKIIQFKEDTDPDMRDVFAYVYSSDKDNVVYLCNQFWKASPTLCEDSQPGTIIHEVSHLLGTEDITYDRLTVELYEDYGILMGRSQRCKDEREFFQINANSLEHEFETIINHEKPYCNGRYECCGETKKNSVCRHRSRGHYILHERFGKKAELELRVGKSKEMIAPGLKTRYVKQKNKSFCSVYASSEEPSSVILSGEKKKIVEEAKEAAIQIVTDAIDKECYGFPVSFKFTCAEPVNSYTFCCIPTKKFLQDLLLKMKDITFMEDTGLGNRNVFAYIIPSNGDVVYLCEEFWKADNTLCKDSKPGTIIHVASHLLGSIDLHCEDPTLKVYEQNQTLKGDSQKHEEYVGNYVEDMVQINANSLEHEFETIINHEKPYCNGRYKCCGETKKNSVCRDRSTGHYILHERFGWAKEEMERRVANMQEAATLHVATEGKKKKYVKGKNKACEMILVSET